MHGKVLDWVVLNTVKNGLECLSGQEHGSREIKYYNTLSMDNLPIQKKFKRILDIGSLDINGSMRFYDFLGRGPTWLSLVSDTGNYIGIDLIPGHAVDYVMNSHDILFNQQFDLILCLEMLEHDTDPEKTVKEAYRVLIPNGLLLVATVDESAEEHGTENHHPGCGGGSRHYEKIAEKRFRDMILSLNSPFYRVWHDESDLFATILK